MRPMQIIMAVLLVVTMVTTVYSGQRRVSKTRQRSVATSVSAGSAGGTASIRAYQRQVTRHR